MASSLAGEEGFGAPALATDSASAPRRLDRRSFCLGASSALALLNSSCGTTPARTRIPMNRRAIHPVSRGFAQAHEITGAERILFVSGQVPVTADDTVPATFKEQCRLAWRNVEAELEAAGMGLENLAKTTMFLADRKYRQEAYEVRQEVFPPHVQPAMTIVITGIYDEAWLLEIEAIAVG